MQTARLLTFSSSRTNIGCMILQLRKRLKLSQLELGQAIGVSQSSISQYEKGTTTPSPDVVRKLIEYAKGRDVQVSFESIYAGNGNGVIDRTAASDDAQPPVGGTSDKRKESRLVDRV
jgi:transcriptional regulator with XRE-family HTH domain